jgi:hypothetical protein
MAFVVVAASSAEPQKNERPIELTVRHTPIAALGGEHIAHAIYRHTPAEGSIVGWGERIVQWPLDNLQLREIVPREGDLRYYNGGCRLDVNGDGRDEIVLSRGKTRSGRDPELLWIEEAANDHLWAIHVIESIGTGPIAPHDIEPFQATLPRGQTVRGVVAVIDRQRLVWYEIPSDPREPWKHHPIADLPRRAQSGIAVGDMAGHGRPYVACGMYWAECPADPTKEAWKVRRFGPL